MTPIDRLLQRWRIAKARRYIAHGAQVLDIGCGDGALLRDLAGRIGYSVGIDPTIAESFDSPSFRLIRGQFPEDLSDVGPFDAIVALAVLEHLPVAAQRAMAIACLDLLKPGGRLIITVPSPIVDRILHVLQALRLTDFGEVHQHYGYRPKETIPTFEAVGLAVTTAKRFQLGVNNLFVFDRPVVGDASTAASPQGLHSSTRTPQ
jgi:2-polyprenyl-3-methyl-5-hydroxy-6-metoxy-1,4-benzoquinol methylase